jgi:cytoskeleton protein RodZ
MSDLSLDSFSTIGQEGSRGGPGKRMREAREALHWTHDHVARELHLSSRAVQDLEQDDYRFLPPPVFVRGYLRSYARLLGIPEQEIMDAYRQLRGEEQDVGIAAPDISAQAVGAGHRMRWLTYVIILSIVALPVIWWKTQGSFKFWEAELVAGPGDERLLAAADGNGLNGTPVTPAVPPVGVGATAADDPSGMASDALLSGRGVEAEDGVAMVAPAGGSDLASSPPQLPAVDAEALPATATASPAGSDSTTAASAADGQDTVVMRFASASWVQVVDGAGKRLLYETAPEGSTRTLRGEGPFKVVLGKPGGVVIELNGQPFDHRFSDKRGVARFVVGATTEATPGGPTAAVANTTE